MAWQGAFLQPLAEDASFGGIADHHLTEHLVQGKGIQEDGERDTFVEAHCRSFIRLRKRRSLWGNKPQKAPSLNRGTGAMLSRYRAACVDCFSHCLSLGVALDGSRVGGKEMLLIVIVGTNPEGETKCVWAPPQARP